MAAATEGAQGRTAGSGTRLYAVGGIGADDVDDWAKAGVSGFGFGSELFGRQYSLDEIAERAQRIVGAVQKAMTKNNSAARAPDYKGETQMNRLSYYRYRGRTDLRRLDLHARAMGFAREGRAM